jgi:hypothetical protein
MSTIIERAMRRQSRRETPAISRWSRLLLAPGNQRKLILMLLLLFCYSFFHQVPVWNEYSRYDLVLALVDDHTTRIDPYHENTGDKAFYNGHYYSDKAPGSALLAAPTYALIRSVSRLMRIDQPDPGTVMYALALTASGIPTVLLILLLLHLLQSLVGEWWALAMSAGYGLGTIAFPFATMYFGHAASTFFLFAAFYTLWCVRATHSVWRPILAGVLAGWAVLVEFTTCLGVVALLFYALSHNRRVLLLMIIGAAPPALLLFGYHWVSFGGPLNLGYANLPDGHFAAGMSQGVFGITRPKLAVLNEILLGPRGLLYLSPWLALAPLGLWRLRQTHVCKEIVLCTAISLAFLTFNAGYYLPFGGWTPGPRFLMPALPFATVLVALAPRAFRPLISLQITFSVVVFTIATTTMPNAPEQVKEPLGDLWLPRLLGRELAETTAWQHWGLHGAQPLFLLGFVVAAALLALLLTTQPSAGGHWLASILAGCIAGLVIGLNAPLDLPKALGLDSRSSAGVVNSEDVITLVDSGVSRIRKEDQPQHVRLWAQLENDEGVVEHTMVIFSIYGPSGEQIWASWHGDVSWKEGERKRLVVEWSTKGAAPGDYRFDLTVMSADQHTIFARIENAGRIRISP